MRFPARSIATALVAALLASACSIKRLAVSGLADALSGTDRKSVV